MPRDNNHRKPTKEVIDVDAFHSRYEDPEGVVQLISGAEFRKSYRIHRKERRAQTQSGSGSRGVVAESSSSGHRKQGQSSTQKQFFPSTPIQKTMSQKRVLPSDPVDTPKPIKRQKTSVHVGPSGLTHFCRDSTLSGEEMPVFPGTSPNRPQTPSSPDLVVVDEKPRQQHLFAASSSITARSSLKRPTPPPNHRTQEGNPISMKASSSSTTTAPRQSENKTIDVIELFSDDENWARVQPTQQYRQPALVSVAQRTNSPIEFPSDSDDSDGDWGPPGLDLNDTDVWLPVPKNVNRDDGVFHSLKTLSISPPPLPLYQCQDTSRWSPPPPPPRQPLHIWDKLQLAENLRWRPRPRPALMQPRKLITRPKDVDLNLHKLNVVTSFKQAPGTINAIEQFEGFTVIGSACEGGLADEPEETQSPYNRAGSLSVWSDNRLVILEGHMRRGLQPKHYTINDIKFDPTSNCFASIGEDKKFRIWALDAETEESKWKITVTFPYTSVPHALAFRPGCSILAVAEKKVLVYDLSDDVVMPPHQFLLHDRGSPHMIGSIAWGCETTADHLFASSEPIQRTFTGAHKAFDLRTQKTIYRFDAEEAGDVLAIDPVGETLGLCTQADANHHILRLYDIRRRSPKAFTSLDLLPFSSRDHEGEMSVATFSPDQIYLALARNDNQTHVYDRRMLGKQGSEPLFKYLHYGESKTVSKHELYGVVHAQWLQSSWTTRMCLVTGGEDGCVRMWDPSVSAHDVENGKVLAEVNYDISQFSIGDPFVGEYRLVVGDSSGEVTIFDHICG